MKVIKCPFRYNFSLVHNIIVFYGNVCTHYCINYVELSNVSSYGFIMGASGAVLRRFFQRPVHITVVSKHFHMVKCVLFISSSSLVFKNTKAT